jgi:hypothetical protein
MGFAEQTAFNVFYPIVVRRIAQHEAAAVMAFRDLCEAFCRVGAFSPASLASDEELRAEIRTRGLTA